MRRDDARGTTRRGSAAARLEMRVVREATEGDGEGREERKRHDVDGARHDDFELRVLRRGEGTKGSPFATVRSPHALAHYKKGLSEWLRSHHFTPDEKGPYM